jgi:hypothetical protein
VTCAAERETEIVGVAACCLAKKRYGSTERLETLGELGGHDDPEDHAEPEQEEEAPVIRRVPSVALVEMPHHPRGILTRKPDET